MWGSDGLEMWGATDGHIVPFFDDSACLRQVFWVSWLYKLHTQSPESYMSRKPTRSFTDAQLIAALTATVPTEDKYPAEDLDGTIYLPKLRHQSYAITPDILCGGVFGISKSIKRACIDKAFVGTNGSTIEYCGKELHQDDETVLLELIHCRAGMATSCEINFSPYAFCKQIGWSDSKHNRKRLMECLLRLRQGLLVVERNGAKGGTVGFLADFTWENTDDWTVRLDDRIVGLLPVNPTYLNIDKRKQLAEGLQTWLLGFVCANNCLRKYKLLEIYAACGATTGTMNEFARLVRDALKKLADINVVEPHSTVKNGEVCIFKKLTHYAKLKAAQKPKPATK
jgi:hypothetical protein